MSIEQLKIAIQRKTGASIPSIEFAAERLVAMGICGSKDDALHSIWMSVR